MKFFIFFNPFVPGFFFFVTMLTIGSFRLPTHSRDAHSKFFKDPFKIKILAKRPIFRTLGTNGSIVLKSLLTVGV